MKSKDSGKLFENGIKGFAWLFGSSIGQYVVQIATLIVLARLLAPADFGVLSAALIITQFLIIFSQVGVGPALVQMKEIDRTHIHTATSISLFLGVLLSLVMFQLADAVANFFNMHELGSVVELLSICLLIASLAIVPEAIMQRNMKFRKLAVINFSAYSVSNLLTAIPLAFLGFGLWALVIAQIVQISSRSFLIYMAANHDKGASFSYKAALKLLNFGFGFTIARVSNYFAGQGDNIVVGRVLSVDALGAYGRAYQMMVLPASLIGTALDKVMFPIMSSIQSETEKLSEIYMTGISIVAMFCFPISFYLIIFSHEMVYVLLGSQWEAVVAPFQLLALFLIFRLSYKLSDSMARALGAVYRRAWRQVVYAFLVFVGSLLGAPYGLSGVAIGVGFAIFVNFLLMLQLTHSLIGFSVLKVVRVHITNVIPGLLAASSLFMLKEAVLYNLHPIISLASGGVFFFLIWISSVFIMRAFLANEISFMKSGIESFRS